MKWISVKDKLPDENISVLVTDGEQILIGYYEKRWGWSASGVSGYDFEWEFDDTFRRESPVAYWSELPELPNVKQKGDDK